MSKLTVYNPLKLSATGDAEESEEFLEWKAIHSGTYPEYLVFRELERAGLQYGADFQFQSSMMGGRRRLGGAVVDFDLPMYRILGRVQGEYWHLRAASTREHDLVQRLALEGMGYTVVDMLASEIIERPHEIVRLFLRGEMSATASRASVR